MENLVREQTDRYLRLLSELTEEARVPYGGYFTCEPHRAAAVETAGDEDESVSASPDAEASVAKN